jgi:cytochrome oxidase Cu insertion factor (SCO1/SenC/PrrC family)
MQDVAKPNKTKFLVIVALFALPIVASYLTYFVWTPKGGVKNYGALIKPETLPETLTLTAINSGAPTTLQTLRGKWLLVQVDAASCPQACEQKLYAMRQVRLMQGREQDRVLRLWLVDDGRAPAALLLQKYAGTLLFADPARGLMAKLAAHSDPKQGIYMIDPRGNLMMRWPSEVDIKRMHKDIERLLKASQMG